MTVTQTSGRPKGGYKLADGTKIPGVTTIIGRFKDSAALMFWAFAQGKAGKEKLYDDAEKAAEIGTYANRAGQLREGQTALALLLAARYL